MVHLLKKVIEMAARMTRATTRIQSLRNQESTGMAVPR